MEELKLGALRVRGWSRGCELCWRGSKAVVFITGLCNLYSSCFYCTISSWRRGRDVQFVDEIEVKDVSDVIAELRAIDAEGMSVTGGEPALVLDRVLRYIKIVRGELGAKLHIHMYTNGVLMDEEKLSKLADVGLDEIRFHSWDDDVWNLVEAAQDSGLCVGFEMPAIPLSPYIRRLKDLALHLDRGGGRFLNLNELEFSEMNRKELLHMGLKPSPESEVAVSGSRDAAKDVLSFVERNTGIDGYFCPAAQKDYQMWTRWRRRAKRAAESYEDVTEDGTVFRVELSGSKLLLRRITHALHGEDFAVSGEKVMMPLNTFKKLVEEDLVDLNDLECFGVEYAPLPGRRIEVARYPCSFLLRSLKKDFEVKARKQQSS